ncbi:MAG TPA: methyltransferase domain-containing protein [Rhodanobacter sp.]|nr:methyltransferase domain-containing protein [Rhodanobacter sp.]
MHPRDHDIYASAPLRHLRDAQARVLAPDLQRCAGSHALLLGATVDDAPPALPLLGCWVRLYLAGGGYRGDLQAAIDQPLPFIDEAFELVMMRHVLERTPHTSALLAEAVRVLAPGGVLVLSGVHPVSGWAPWLHWRTRGEHLSLHLPLHLRHHLLQAGMDIERVSRTGSPLPGMTTRDDVSSRLLGGGYVLVARKLRRMVTPLRIRPVPVRVPASGHLSPGTRRQSTR